MPDSLQLVAGDTSPQNIYSYQRSLAQQKKKNWEGSEGMGDVGDV